MSYLAELDPPHPTIICALDYGRDVRNVDWTMEGVEEYGRWLRETQEMQDNDIRETVVILRRPNLDDGVYNTDTNEIYIHDHKTPNDTLAHESSHRADATRGVDNKASYSSPRTTTKVIVGCALLAASASNIALYEGVTHSPWQLVFAGACAVGGVVEAIQAVDTDYTDDPREQRARAVLEQPVPQVFTIEMKPVHERIWLTIAAVARETAATYSA